MERKWSCLRKASGKRPSGGDERNALTVLRCFTIIEITSTRNPLWNKSIRITIKKENIVISNVKYNNSKIQIIIIVVITTIIINITINNNYYNIH